jgi:hypothetical protein
MTSPIAAGAVSMMHGWLPAAVQVITIVAMIAPQPHRFRGVAVSSQHGTHRQRLDRLLPHGFRRLESAARRPAARSDRPSNGRRDAIERGCPLQRSAGPGHDKRCRIALHPPRRMGLSSAGPVRHQSPADWVRAGEAVSALDAFASAHGGNAPVAVFVDSGGAFSVHTECVNGPRGMPPTT